ncbi:MAG TPA: hypothetical protein VGG29_16290 [Caulobacteraceae bacterium]|jgi:hypothetical protein
MSGKLFLSLVCAVMTTTTGVLSLMATPRPGHPWWETAALLAAAAGWAISAFVYWRESRAKSRPKGVEALPDRPGGSTGR